MPHTEKESLCDMEAHSVLEELIDPAPGMQARRDSQSWARARRAAR